MLVNEGKWDRAIRVVIGLAILTLVPFSTWAWLGILPLASGVSGYCLLYHLLGWSTNRVPKKA